MLVDTGRELNAKYGRKIHLTSKDPSEMLLKDMNPFLVERGICLLGLYFATPCIARSVTEKNWWP